WCGENISRTVDVKKVAEEAAKMPGVVHAEEYKYMCSDPGQGLILKAMKEKNLTGVVVAACSPRMHELTFRNLVEKGGMNPFLCEIANIREHCSWVHENKAEATAKAVDLVRSMVEKVKRNKPLNIIRVPVTDKALVIGGGIAGIQAALDIANGGRKVILVEKDSSIGGHMAQLSETFPTLDCSQCILTPRMVEVARHPNITLYTYSEVTEVGGFVGNFEVTIRRKATSIHWDKCTGCGMCTEKCPQKKIPSEFDAGLGNRKAVYVPFPQAVPNKPVIDRERCIKFKTGKCGACEKVCPAGAVDYSMEDEFIKEKVGAIVVATGFDVLPTDSIPEYGYGKYKDVLNGLQFERLASASGPTLGELKRPSDGKEPQSIVFIQCAGSRDCAKGIPYCSKICCMYTAKHTMLYKHKVHDGQAYVFYMDIRAAGKGYDEFVRRAIEEDGAMYLRGRVSRIYEDNGQLVVSGVDTLSNKQVSIRADMVVLATAGVARPGMDKLAQVLGISYDPYNFFSEAHPKLRPVETSRAGVFLAGACQAPKDIPESVAQASAAASKVLGLFSSDELEREPTVASVNENTCIGCLYCTKACAYGAISPKEIRNRQGALVKVVANVNPGLCQGCGACAATCRSNSIELAGYTDDQICAQICAL
ncbi:MAG TPA: CoB--CoM heterodisulfide reductase iron-sulfur subunit A family protein, partial [bacterium]|nr:CoB--CoM heterodisulfide reductase iron-sulfur subunit A family protein [bacterium]